MDSITSQTNPFLVTAAFAFVPYALVAWGYTELADGNCEMFWTAFGVLLGARLFFSIIESLGGILWWRLYGKKNTVQKVLEMLRVNRFPLREYKHDDISNYIARIKGNDEILPPVKIAAYQLEFLLATSEDRGILEGARIFSAAEIALDAYSPKSLAPEFPWESK